MNIFEAKTTSAYVLARIKMLPHKGRGEASRIAKFLGISSTLISQILSGDRQLSPEQGELLVEYLSLRPLEADYFLFLLQHERAGTARLREYWRKKIEKIRNESKILVNRIDRQKVFSESEKAVFYSSPLYSAVRLYTSTRERGRSIEEVAERFSLSRSKVAKIMTFLVETGLVVEEKGYFKMGPQSTHLENGSPHLIKHHSNWRIKAVQYADDLNESELMFTSPASLSKEDFDKLREKMVLFIGEFLKSAQASPAEEIACFNMDFFWIKK
ncbi:MAG: DUF4423 domain-containing protein [Bdellovibrionota bacterium]